MKVDDQTQPELEIEFSDSQLDDVFILTEESKVVSDPTTDPFLKAFNPDNVPHEQTYFELQKNYENRTGTAGSKQFEEGEGFSLYHIVDCVEVPYNQVMLAALYEKNAIHAAAVDAKIDNIIGLGYYWDYSRKADKIRERAARKDDDSAKQRTEDRLIDDRETLDDAVNDMNRFDEFDETLTKVLKDRFTTGNGYFEIGRRRDGTIGYIGHIPSATMRVRRVRDGFVQYVDNQPIFFRNFGDRKTRDPFGNDPQPNEIIHYKQYTPSNNYYGVPEIVAAIDNIAGMEFANKYNIDYFENSAVPRYIITTKNVTIGNGTLKKIMTFFEKETRGKHHRSLLIPLPNANAEIEFTPVETKKQEASYIEYIDQNAKHILARHRTPANRLGMSAGTGIGDSRDGNKIFKESVCGPEQRLIEKKLARVFRELTDLFVFKLNEYTLTDENEQSAIHERQLRMGMIVPDEGRAEIGLPPRADGNGDLAIDVRAMLEMEQASAEKMQAETIKSSEKLAAQSNKATVEAAKVAPKPAGGAAAGAAASANKATATKSRTRDANRSANSTDSATSTKSRASKGSGRQQA